MSLNFDLLWKYLTPKDCLNVSGWLDNSGIWLPVKAMEKKGLYRCLWSPESLGIFFFTVPSLAHSLIKRAPVQLQTFDYTELAVGTSFIGLRPADSKCLPWEAGSCSLCYITVLSWSALSVHTCIFWGQHLNSCYQEFQGLTVLFITLGDTFLHSKCLLSNAQRELSSLVQLDAQLLWFRRCTVEVKDTGLLSFWMSQFICSFHGMIAI